MRLGKLVGHGGGRRERFEPPRTMLAGTDLLASYQIGFADYAYDVIVIIDHGKCTNVVLGEKPDHAGDVVLRARGHDVADHDIHRFHSVFPSRQLTSCLRAAAWSARCSLSRPQN